MKIRNGFVSNSSSSSFTCDVCGENVSGMDLCIDDAEMSECVNGHTVCDSHLEEGEEPTYEDMSFDEKKEYCLQFISWEGTIKRLKAITDEDELDDFYNDEVRYDERYNVAASRCPCCCLTSPTTKQVLEFMLYAKGMTRQDAEDEMRTVFTNYNEMMKKIGK